MKRVFSTDYSRQLPRKALYNPNTFNPLDSGIAYLAVLAAFALLSHFGGNFLSDLWRGGYISDYYLLMVINALMSQATILLVGLLFCSIKRVKPFSGGGFVTQFKWIDMLFALVLITGVLLTFSPLHAAFAEYATYYGVPSPTVDPSILEQSNPLFMIIYAFILVPILPAFCEELMYRSVIMRGFRRWGMFPAVILSALMFSFMHGSFQQMLLQFLGGLAIAFAVMVTGNFMMGIVMHFANNFLAMAFAVAYEPLAAISTGLYNTVQALSIVIGVAMLIIGVYYFIRKYLASFKRKACGEKAIPKQTRACFSSAAKCDKDSFTAEIDDCPAIIDKHPDALYLTRRGTFRRLNGRGSNRWAVVFIVLSLLFALTEIFLALFGINI